MFVHTLKTSQNDGSLKILKLKPPAARLKTCFLPLWNKSLRSSSEFTFSDTVRVWFHFWSIFFPADSKRRRVKYFMLGIWTLLASVLQRRPECLLTALTLDLLQPQTPGRYKLHVSLTVSWQGEPLGRSAQTGISRTVVLTHSLLHWLPIYFKILVWLLLNSFDWFIVFFIHCRLHFPGCNITIL